MKPDGTAQSGSTIDVRGIRARCSQPRAVRRRYAPECLENDPNNEPAAAQRVNLPVIVNGRIDRPGDVDLFYFEGRRRPASRGRVKARRLDSSLDSALKLTDSAGKQVAFNDDYEDKAAGLTTHHADSRLSATLPSDGPYYCISWTSSAREAPTTAIACIWTRRGRFRAARCAIRASTPAGTTVPITVHALGETVTTARSTWP